MTPVIIESPFAGDVEANLEYARACIRHSLSLGEAPFASHLLYTQPGILDDDVPEERTWGINAGFVWGGLAGTTAVYVDRGMSNGMRLGIADAVKNGRTIVYRSLHGEVTPEMFA